MAKIIKRPIIALLCAVALFLVIVFSCNKIMLLKEKSYLKKLGYYNPVETKSGLCINVVQRGSETPGHRIVVLADLGMSDTSVSMENMLSGFYADNKVIYVDRAGYGLSDDTKTPRTNEDIVSDYRSVLKAAGIETPYILMAHSVGGVYATYWETKYPEEIEAVIFMDGTQLSEDAYEDFEESSPFRDFLDLTGCKLGFGRLFLRSNYYLLPAGYSKEQQKTADALSVRQVSSAALKSEGNLRRENGLQAYREIEKNDIPKLYICSSWGISTEEEFREHTAWIREQQKLNHLNTPDGEVTSEKIAKYLDMYEVIRESLLEPYIEKLGNCELKLLGGDHMIYEQRPEDCAKIIEEFLAELPEKEK